MAKAKALSELPWMAPFLAELAVTRHVRRSALAASISPSSPYNRRKIDPDFAAAWDACMSGTTVARASEATDAPSPPGRRKNRAGAKWPKFFLRALADTSCVTAAAEAAQVETGRAYRMRRENPQFAVAWRAALAEGYDHLEMEMLAVLRGYDSGRRIDVPNAVRLLAAHRKTVAEIRAFQEPDDEQAVLDSIDALIDGFRREAAAADARAAEAATQTATTEREAGDGERG